MAIYMHKPNQKQVMQSDTDLFIYIFLSEQVLASLTHIPARDQQ